MGTHHADKHAADIQDQEASEQVPLVDGHAMLCSTPFMTTKLRPGVFNFLNTLKEHFMLFIYTMGDASYARNMANLLDPTGSGLFLNRIIDRGDSDWEAHQKGLSKVCAADMTAIIDDTVGTTLQSTMSLFV
jgi:TFIIF-interacting CTD phosphatase-like protein